MLNKMMELLKANGYRVNKANETMIELKFVSYEYVILVIRGQVKVYKYVNDSIKKESKWYKRPSYAIKFMEDNL